MKMNSELRQLPFDLDDPCENASDLPTLLTVICHLMTCHTLRPCRHLAKSVERHFEVLQRSYYAHELGPWADQLESLRFQWAVISEHYANRTARQLKTTKPALH